MAAQLKPSFNDTAFAQQAGALVSRLTKAQQEAVNATGVAVMARLRTDLEEETRDGPVRFTLNSFSLFRARGRHTDAAIAIKPLQEDYMRYAFEGGTQRDEVIPSRAARLNRYGNMTRRYTQGIVNQKKGFWRTARSGVRTLFVRTKDGGIEAVAFKVKRLTYKPWFDPIEKARATVEEVLPAEAEKAFAKAFADG